MKAKDIKVGKTYKNSGAGKTQRHVLAIGPYHPADMPAMWNSDAERPDALVVKYMPVGPHDPLPVYQYLHTFANWAAGEVVQEPATQTLELTNDLQQNVAAPETGAVAYLVFMPNGDESIFTEFAEAQGVALDALMSPISTETQWRVYPLYAGRPITGG